LTKGEIGEDPETGLINEPLDSSSLSSSEEEEEGSSRHCIICDKIERQREKKRMIKS
jgi:hypothetical protein